MKRLLLLLVLSLGIGLVVASITIYWKKPADGPIIVLPSGKVSVGNLEYVKGKLFLGFLYKNPRIDRRLEYLSDNYYDSQYSIVFRLDLADAQLYKDLCPGRCKLSYSMRPKFNWNTSGFWERDYFFISIEPL